MATDKRSVKVRVKELTQQVLTDAKKVCTKGDAVRNKRPHFMDIDDVETAVRAAWKATYGDSQFPAAKRAITNLVTLENDADFVWCDCTEPIGRMMRNSKV